MTAQSTASPRLSFGKKLTLMILGIVITSVCLIAATVFSQYYRSHTQMIINQLAGQGERYAQSFIDWLDARQDEMRFLARLTPVIEGDFDATNHLLQQTAQVQGFYDTIFVVSPQGLGTSGVSYSQNRANILPLSEAQAFSVPDRDWFKQAISGRDVFSQPVISRATGNQVSTVAVPIYKNNQIVSVMRGAVTLDTLINRVRELNQDPQVDIYLINTDGQLLTPSRSMADTSRAITSQASEAIAQMMAGSGRYLNGANEEVVGSYIPIPVLGWGLVLEVKASEAMRPVQKTVWILLFFFLFIVIAATAIGLLIVRSIVQTLGGDPTFAASVVRRVAQGDLTVTIPISKHQESSLLGSIEAMRKSLSGTIDRIKTNSETLASSATELSQISQETDRGVKYQSSQLDNAATAINEMAATVEEVARSAQSAADQIVHASEKAKIGGNIVSSSVASMHKLSDEISKAAEIIQNLKSDSDTIGSVLQVIRDVASQTNLLALNASIEAARAGDSGRGFAVVADEVRGLARRTEESTNEIQSVINQLQSRAEQAVSAINQSVEHTESTLESSEKANVALDEILALVHAAHDMIQHIATATEEQSAVAKEINQNIHGIKDIADQSAEHVGQSTEATNALSQLAEQLHSEMNRFNV
ncbi:methyl-accepting chemotaxis protein [Nitrincola nitratireducens]|uniref:Uncharacterized protein n=1 Tax=Nitrincola nitratireducens TaxID=1229521 RepID=W9VRL9_9GAMM|nr:methyl-accepting chemotaxis protein [Nitrincola nitratireducens]EXJ13060.1 hypothetical protein D791_00408 [Nitrincola nitratireducens]